MEVSEREIRHYLKDARFHDPLFVDVILRADCINDKSFKLVLKLPLREFPPRLIVCNDSTDENFHTPSFATPTFVNSRDFVR